MKKMMTMAALAMCALSAQAQDVSFSIKGTAPEGTKMVYAVYNNQRGTTDSTQVVNGKFELRGEKPANTFVSLMTKETPGFAVVTDGNPIEVDMAGTTVKGSALNQKFVDFQRSLVNEEKELGELVTQYRKLAQDNSADAQAQLQQVMAKYETIAKSVFEKEKAFIAANKDNVLPAYYLIQMFYDFDYAELKDLCAEGTGYYDHTLMGRPKAQVASLAKRQPGLKFTDLVMNDMEGKEAKLSQWVGKGNYVLVDFWASWCGPCRAEMPHVVAAYDKYKAKGFEVVGVSFDSKADAWKKGVADLGLAWPQISDLKGWKCAAAEAYGVNSIPSNVLVDGNGVIVATDLRGDDLAAKLAEVYGE